LRQLADADEILRIERADTMDEVVADLRPFEADAFVADMVAHAGGARRENGQIGAALALQLELVLFDAFANFVVGNLQRGPCGQRRLVLGNSGRSLFLAEAMKILGLGGVMAVAIDDHDGVAELAEAGMLRTAVRLSNSGGFSIACRDRSQRRLTEWLSFRASMASSAHSNPASMR
jgi:hypothetical protein